MVAKLDGGRGLLNVVVVCLLQESPVCASLMPHLAIDMWGFLVWCHAFICRVKCCVKHCTV